MDAGDGRSEQLLSGVAEERAARAVGGQDPVAEGVHDEGRLAGFLEQLPELVIAMHLRLALHRGARLTGAEPAGSAGGPGCCRRSRRRAGDTLASRTSRTRS